MIKIDSLIIDDLQQAFLESSSLSFDEFYDKLIMMKKSRSINTRNTLKSVLTHIALYSTMEDVLSGSVFMVCRDWYSELLNNEFLWNTLYERLIQSSMEFAEVWKQSHPTQIHNYYGYDFYLVIKTDVSPKEKLQWSVPLKSDYSWQFKKAFCLSKYSSYSKHLKLGTIKTVANGNFECDSCLLLRDLEPNLNSVFQITTQEGEKPLYFTRSSSNSAQKRMSSRINFSMDYYNIALPHQSFTMNVAINLYENDGEHYLSHVSVETLESLRSFSNNSNAKLELVKSDGANTPNINQENVQIFATEWLGEKGDISPLWLLKFITSLRIHPLTDAINTLTYV